MDKNTDESVTKDVEQNGKAPQSTMEKGLHQGRKVKYKKSLLAVLIVLLITVVIAGFFVGYEFILQGEFGIGTDNKAGTGRGVCEMFISGDTMYYTNYKDTLYRYDDSDHKGAIVSKIEIADGSQIFEDKGYVYYSNSSTIFKRDINGGAAVKLIKGKNIWVDAVEGDRLYYHIAYKDTKGGFSEFENHIYELETGKDEVLFNRSEDMWHLLDADGDIAIADATLKNDFGLFAIDATAGTYKKLSSMRAVDGCIIGGKFYFTTYDNKGLRSVDIKEGKQEEVLLLGIGKDNYFVDRIAGFGDSLYAAAYYDGENHIVRVDLKTHGTTTLAHGFGRVWRLCTDGKNVYIYETKSPADKEGKITAIPAL